MFYAHFVLSKKGPLAKVWLAAHWEKKLTKTQVFETDVEKTVDDIISPKVKMALRTSGHLLLGVVRIYSRKQKYLIQDLNEACAKIKMAFRPGIVDLPLDKGTAPGETITLPEIFENFESAMQDLGNVGDIEEDKYRSRAEDITLRDEVSSNKMFTISDFQPLDNEFGGMLEDIEVPRKSSLSFQSHASDSSHLIPTEGVGPNLLQAERQFENRGLEDFGDMGGFGDFGLQDDLLVPPPLPSDEPMIPQIDDINFDTSAISRREGEGEGRGEPMEVDTIVIPPQEQTVREDQGFVLEPLDVTGIKKRQKRKRKLVVDKEKELQGDTIRAQLQDPSDTMHTLSFPGPKRKVINWKKDTITLEHIFHKPTIPSLCPSLSSLITRNQSLTDPLDVKACNVSLSTDVEVPRDEDVPMVPAETTGPSVVNDTAHEDNNMLPDYDMMMDHNEPPPLLPPIRDDGEEEDEERVTRIIPDLPDLESDLPLTQDTPLEEGSANIDTQGERRWNRKTHQVLKILERGFEQTDTLHFTDITRKCNRKQAASRFYSLLLLGKEGTVHLKQGEPYSTIVITKPLTSGSMV